MDHTSDLPFRQIHLDFHTSPLIPEVGRDFDPEAFVETLRRAHVNSINLFARCHHGYLYYDSRAFPERIHPTLQRRNLLAEQIEACHRHGIRTPIYITVRWDKYSADRHSDWLVNDERGNPVGTPPLEAGFYRLLCLNSPYVDFLKALTGEILDLLPVDGFWFDIVWPYPCACVHCREGMEREGLNPARPEDRERYGREVLRRFIEGMTGFVRTRSPAGLIFYNRGHVNPALRPVLNRFTHLELESLPSGGWGYLHFPWTMRYARTLGLPCVGMTGKFHRSWGDFHSFKNRAALEFECFQMLALGARCCVGDQLHPRGRLCPVTYRRIGEVYTQVENKEPWCRGAEPVVDIGVLTPEEFSSETGHRAFPRSGMGVTRLLEEGRHPFDVVDSRADFSRYRLLVLPDTIPAMPELAHKLSGFVRGGGALIASHRSGLVPEGHRFGLPCLGVSLLGEAPYSPDFLAISKEWPAGMEAAEYVMDLRALQVCAKAGTRVLTWVHVPYFNREGRFFCSHRHTPSSFRRGYPGIVQRGRCIYFAHPIFETYQKWAPRWVKELFLAAVTRLLPDPLVRVDDAPSTLRVTVMWQAAERRVVVHLLHYVPERRGEELDIVEDVIPLRDVKLSLRWERPQPQHVRCVPSGPGLPFRLCRRRVEFSVPECRGHQMVELALGDGPPRERGRSQISSAENRLGGRVEGAWAAKVGGPKKNS